MQEKGTRRFTTNHTTNEEWLSALQCQDRRAIGDLRDILLGGLSIALSVRMDYYQESILEDFVQEALVRILKSLSSFRGESHFTTWAHRIALNVAYSEFRKVRWRNISLQDLIEQDNDMDRLPILSDRAASPEQRITQRNIFDIVQRLINEELSERQRRALSEIVLNGTPYEEAARLMGTNRNALYKLVFDARQKLRVLIHARAQLTPQDVFDLF